MSIQTAEFGELYNEDYIFIKNIIQLHYTELELEINKISDIKIKYNKLKYKYDIYKSIDCYKELYNIKLEKIKNAYECLSDKKLKDVYDEQIQTTKNLLQKYYIKV